MTQEGIMLAPAFFFFKEAVLRPTHAASIFSGKNDRSRNANLQPFAYDPFMMTASA
jgi:hypothetical protein